MEHFAICTRCKNSVVLKKSPLDNYACPLCNQDFGRDLNRTRGLLIDFEGANQTYEVGQEYFRNTDFGEALKYFEKTLESNQNHYLAVYFSRMCKIYLEEHLADFDLVESIALALVESVNSVVLARIEASKRLGFFTLIYNECYILLLNYYKRLVTDYSSVDSDSSQKLRNSSFRFALSIKKIINIDKESIFAHNPNISKICIAIADIGITACHNVVQPYIVDMDGQNELSLPTDTQYYKVRSLCKEFMTFAQSLNAAFVQSVSTNYGDVLLYIDKNVVPMRNRYYEVNKSFTPKHLSYKPDLFKKLAHRSSFAVKYAHRICFSDLFRQKGEYYDLLIYESVDNCFDSLMPRIQLLDRGKADIYNIGLKDALVIADQLNDFLKELYKLNREYAIKKVYSFFKYVFDGVNKYYLKTKKTYFRISTRLNDDDYQLELGSYLNFLYQVASTCVITTLVDDLDRNVVGNTREEMLGLALDACIAFDSMSEIDVNSITALEKFSDFNELFTIIKHACGLDRGVPRTGSKGKRVLFEVV